MCVCMCVCVLTEDKVTFQITQSTIHTHSIAGLELIITYASQYVHSFPKKDLSPSIISYACESANLCNAKVLIYSV